MRIANYVRFSARKLDQNDFAGRECEGRKVALGRDDV
jgi:hypothetical protein